MSVRADHDGKVIKRSILGSIEEFMRTTEAKLNPHTASMSEESMSRSNNRRAGNVRRSVGSNISNNGFGSAASANIGRQRISNNRLNYSVDFNSANNVGIS